MAIITPPTRTPEDPIEQVVGFLRSCTGVGPEIENFIVLRPMSAPADARDARAWSWRLEAGAPPTPDYSLTRFPFETDENGYRSVGRVEHPMIVRGVVVELDGEFCIDGDDSGADDQALVSEALDLLLLRGM